MAATTTSKRAVFRTNAEHPDYHWPFYRHPDPEYTAIDLGVHEYDVPRLASAWFKQEGHDDVEAFICWRPLIVLTFIINLLASVDDLVRIDRVLINREFDSQHVLKAVSEYGKIVLRRCA